MQCTIASDELTTTDVLQAVGVAGEIGSHTVSLQQTRQPLHALRIAICAP